MGKTTNEIRRRIAIKEERLDRELTNEERQRIIKNVKRKVARENLIRGAFLALGITIGAGGHALLTGGNSEGKPNEPGIEVEVDNENDQQKNFTEDLKVTITPTLTPVQEEQVNSKEILNNIIEQYNNTYNMQLTEEDISFIKSKPQFLGIDQNGGYVQDYKEKTPVEKYTKENIDYIYILINNKDNSIISSLGRVDREYVNVDTKVVMNSERKEYMESEQKIDLTADKDKEEIKQTYEALEELYQEQTKEVNGQER